MDLNRRLSERESIVFPVSERPSVARESGRTDSAPEAQRTNVAASGSEGFIYANVRENVSVSPASDKSGALNPLGERRSVYLQRIYDTYDVRQPVKNRLLRTLANVDKAVERIRKEAMLLEEEKDHLSTILESLQNSDTLAKLSDSDREDVLAYVERVSVRFATIQLSVVTNRNQEQEEALNQVNAIIDDLVVSLKTDVDSAKIKCLMYVAACSSNPHVLTDKNFESVILSCTVDDQKRIKKRLQGLLDYIDSEFDVSVDKELAP